MHDQLKTFILALSFILVIPQASALGQVGRGVGGIGGGARPGTSGVRGLSSPRSGLGTRSNPIVNPSPSLTPNEVLNPRGSLSSGQVLNPEPSLGRPRSGGSAPAVQQSVARWGSASRLARPNSGDRTTSYFDALTAELRQFKNGESLAKYLALPTGLRSVEMTEGASEDARKLLKRFDKLSSDPAYAKVTALPKYWLAHASLKLKLDPPPALTAAMQQALRSTDPASTGDDLSRSFDQLGDQLREYKNGESWAKYLALPKELLSGETNKGTSEPTAKLLKRFDKVSSDPTYAKVTALVAFRPAHEALRMAADQTDTSPPPSAVVEKQPVAPGNTIATADKKPDANKKPVAATEKKPEANTKPIADTDSADPVPMHQSVGGRILKSVVALENQLAKVAPDKGWQKRLSIDDLEVGVLMTSDQPSSDSDRTSLAEILETYQTIAKNKDDAIVNQLPEFKETLQALQEYLKPRDAQPPKD